MEDKKNTKYNILIDICTFAIIGSIIYIDSNNLFVSNGSKIDIVGNVIYWIAGLFLGGGLLLALFGTYNIETVLQAKEKRPVLSSYAIDFALITATFFLKNRLLYTSIKAIGYFLTFSKWIIPIVLIGYMVDKKQEAIEVIKQTSISHLIGGIMSAIFLVFILYILKNPIIIELSK